MNSQDSKHQTHHTEGGTPRPVRLLVCDDQVLVRVGVGYMLSQAPSFEVIGEAADGRAAVEMAIALQPDIILMDVSMPKLDGIEATRQILAQLPTIKIVAFSVDSSPETVGKMLSVGARGYVFKTGVAEELHTALHKVLAGEVFLSVRGGEART